MITVTNHELLSNPAHVQAQAEKAPVLITGNEKKQILLNYDDYLLLLDKKTRDKHLTTKPASKPFVSLHEAFSNVPADLSEAVSEIEEPPHFSKIAHALGYEKISDTGIEFGDSLDAALDALNAEIAAMKNANKTHSTAKLANKPFVSLHEAFSNVPADLAEIASEIEFYEQ